MSSRYLVKSIEFSYTITLARFAGTGFDGGSNPSEAVAVGRSFIPKSATGDLFWGCDIS